MGWDYRCRTSFVSRPGAGCRGHSTSQQAEEIGAYIARSGRPRCCGDVKPSEERLRIALVGGRSGRLGFAWGHAKNIYSQVVNGLSEVVDASRLEALMGAGDELIDLRFVFAEEGVDVCFVEHSGALGLW